LRRVETGKGRGGEDLGGVGGSGEGVVGLDCLAHSSLDEHYFDGKIGVEKCTKGGERKGGVIYKIGDVKKIKWMWSGEEMQMEEKERKERRRNKRREREEGRYTRTESTRGWLWTCGAVTEMTPGTQHTKKILRSPDREKNSASVESLFVRTFFFLDRGSFPYFLPSARSAHNND